MRILHILAQLPEQTGSGNAFKSLVEGLDQKGVENALIYAEQESNPINLRRDYSYPVKFQTDELPFSIVGMSDVMPYDHSIYSEMTEKMVEQWQKAFQTKFAKAQEEFQPDLVIVHHLWYLASLALDFFGDIPVIAASHATDLRQAIRHPHLKERYVKMLNRLAMVFSLSQFDKEQLIATFAIEADKIYITANGFNREIFYPSVSRQVTNRIHILYAGKLTDTKGVFQLAQTFPQLKSKYSQLKMTFVGNGEEDNRDYLTQLAQAENCSDFRQLPAVSQKELASIMRQANIFVLPSYSEGLPTIVLEALASGMRVVVSELLPLKELLGEAINQSGMIEYVPLPRLIDQDKPIAEDLPAYIAALTDAIDLQIQRLLITTDSPNSLRQAILAHSKDAVLDKQWQLIQQLAFNKQK